MTTPQAEMSEGPALSRELWRAGDYQQGAATQEPANRAMMAANRLQELAARAGQGERLGSKNELWKLCSVSIGTFNEALKIAQARGYVTLRRGPGGGIFAAQQAPLVKLGNQILAIDDSEHIVADVQRMRNALDPLVLEDALLHSSAADILEMRNELEAMKQAMAVDDIPTFLHGNWRFQACIASISPNVVLRTVFLSLLEVLEQHAVTLPAAPDRPLHDVLKRRYELYEGMADAMEQRDHDAVMQIMHEHNTGVQPAAQAGKRN